MSLRLAIAVAMLFITRFELAIAQSCSSNAAYIARLRAKETGWMIAKWVRQ